MSRAVTPWLRMQSSQSRLPTAPLTGSYHQSSSRQQGHRDFRDHGIEAQRSELQNASFSGDGKVINLRPWQGSDATMRTTTPLGAPVEPEV